MSIRLSVEAEDPEVERLLTHLESGYALPTDDKIFLLQRTIGWLRSSQSITYNLNSAQASSIALRVSPVPPANAVHVGTEFALPQG